MPHQEIADVGAALFAPARASEDGERLAGIREQSGEGLDGAGIGEGVADRGGADVGHGDQAFLHFLR